MATPPNLTYCKIVGNFRAFIADGLDEDSLPDWTSMSGTGSIWPNLSTAKNLTPGQKATYFTAPVALTIDEDGDLGRNGDKFVMVLAPKASSGISPHDFTYTISFQLGIIGEATDRQFGPYTFNVIPGGIVDIVDIIPVTVSGGTITTQGPPGLPNNLTMGQVSQGITPSATITGESPAQQLNLVLPALSPEAQALSMAYALAL